MDRDTFLGGSPLGVLIRLVLLSIVVGVVLSALGITPHNFFYQIRLLLQRIYDLGFGAFQSVAGIPGARRHGRRADLARHPPDQVGAARQRDAR